MCASHCVCYANLELWEPDGCLLPRHGGCNASCTGRVLAAPAWGLQSVTAWAWASKPRPCHLATARRLCASRALHCIKCDCIERQLPWPLSRGPGFPPPTQGCTACRRFAAKLEPWRPWQPAPPHLLGPSAKHGKKPPSCNRLDLWKFTSTAYAKL